MTVTEDDPAIFETPALETANMTVLHCREVLEQTGLIDEARRLEGVSLTNREAAHAALEILHNMKVRAEAEMARQLAVSNVLDALRA